MTVQQMVLELYNKAGSPTDLSPYNVTAEVETYTAGNAGWIKCVTLLNRAYMKLASWKLPTQDGEGKILRFREHTQKIYFQVVDYTPTQTIASVSSNPANVLTFNATPFSALPSLTGWYFNVGGTNGVGGESHTVIANTSSTLTFDQPWALGSSSLVGQNGLLFKRWYPITPSTTNTVYPTGQFINSVDSRKLIAPMKIMCLGSITTGSPLNQEVTGAERTQPFYNYPSMRTFPMLWRLTSRGLEFDNAPLVNTVYEIDFYCEPEQFSTTNTPVYATVDAQIPDLPSAWHEIIWEIAAWLRATVDKNDVETAADYNRINQMILQTVGESERLWDSTDPFVFITG